MRFLFLTCLIFLYCSRASNTAERTYQSDGLEISRVTDHVYQHVSWLETESFGRVACNGMVVVDGGEALIFDTPATEASTSELLRWVEREVGARVKAVVPTHFHADCVAGLPVLAAAGVPAYAGMRTLERLRQDSFAVLPEHGFHEQLRLRAGDVAVETSYLGEGHTRDNVVAYVPADGVLFGGCLIKAEGAGKGNLDDANVVEWPRTVGRVREAYGDAKVVIPGHGERGGVGLLDYTVALFRE